MTKAHKIRLNPTGEQEQYFLRAAGVARFAWNWGLAEYRRIKAEGQKIDWNQLKKDFRSQVSSEFPFVREVTKCAAEEAIADLRRSISTYYKTKKTHPACKFPGLRKRAKRIGGFGLANDKFSLEGHTVRIPKLGLVNMAELFRFVGKILSGRVTEQSGRWYLTVTVAVEPRAQEVPSGSVGIDFGLKSFATLSTGEPKATSDKQSNAYGAYSGDSYGSKKGQTTGESGRQRLLVPMSGSVVSDRTFSRSSRRGWSRPLGQFVSKT